LVYDNKLWLIGGEDDVVVPTGLPNDVWYTTDGTTWTRATANAAWGGRFAFAGEVFDNKMWILGGQAGGYLDDAWYSSDGINWTEAISDTRWSARYRPTAVSFNNKLLVMGGFATNDWVNDIWSTAATRITQYRVCWGTSQGSCAYNALVNATDPLTYTPPNNLTTGTWYFAVQAISVTGQESPLSNPATLTIANGTVAAITSGSSTASRSRRTSTVSITNEESSEEPPADTPSGGEVTEPDTEEDTPVSRNPATVATASSKFHWPTIVLVPAGIGLVILVWVGVKLLLARSI
jgi:hypothetical protein